MAHRAPPPRTSTAGRRAEVRVFEAHPLVTVLAIAVGEAQAGPRNVVVEIDAVVGRDLLVSLHKRPLPFADESEARTRRNPRVGRFDAAYLLDLVLDAMASRYPRVLDRVEDRVERLEEQLLHESGRGAAGGRPTAGGPMDGTRTKSRSTSCSASKLGNSRLAPS
jgi:Mg2+ and Co2+ transporter CorA